MTTEQERMFEEIAARAIAEAEKVPAEFTDFVDGLEIIHLELADRYRSAGAELLAMEAQDNSDVEDLE